MVLLLSLNSINVVLANESSELEEIDNIQADKNLSFTQILELKEQGFTNKSINFLTDFEIKKILDNDYTYGANSQEQYFLYLYDKENPEAYLKTELSKEEYKKYKTELKEKKKLILNKLKALKKQEDNLSKKDKRALKKLMKIAKKEYKEQKQNLSSAKISMDNQVTIAESDVSVKKSEQMGSATLTVYVDYYETTSSVYEEKVVGVNWIWNHAPTQTFVDTVGVSWSGDYWKKDPGYYGGSYWNGVENFTIPVNTSAKNIVQSNYDIQNITAAAHNQQNGRLYMKIKAYKDNVPSQLMNIYGSYVHKHISLGGITLSAGLDGKPSVLAGATVSYNSLDDTPFLLLDAQ